MGYNILKSILEFILEFLMFDSKVSIIIRTKNRLLFLKRAIEDIQNQTFQNWEAVVVNDGGDVQEIEAFWNDDKEILAKFALIHNFKESIGRFTPANVGIKACKRRIYRYS
ncbi:MAG: glycosyltransferase family 2 protein [Desulfobacterales bacterium]|nr:glycosyltransferase family 2 protein [Desulfobacterales bacterium]